MTHRSYRLAIGPERSADPPMVVDFDGRASLQDVQLTLRQAFGLDLQDPHYAFVLAGTPSGMQARYVDPKMVGLRADKALLFRLGLAVGDRFTYACHFAAERRFSVTVESITELPVSLNEPQVVRKPAVQTSARLSELAQAIAVRALSVRSLRLEAGARSQQDSPHLLQELAALALELAETLDQNLPALIELERCSGHSSLTLDLLSLPLELARVSQTGLAMRVARAFEFAAVDEMRGDVALIHALAGEREEALRQVAENLDGARHRYVAEAKAGDVYRTLGELDAAEVYYRRSLAETNSSSERSEATVRLTSFLLDVGRDGDAAVLANAASSST